MAYPSLLLGWFAICLDVFTLILTFATGKHSLWIVPLGTILGIGPFPFGGYLVFRWRWAIRPTRRLSGPRSDSE